jgi:hypothetical protein
MITRNLEKGTSKQVFTTPSNYFVNSQAVTDPVLRTNIQMRQLFQEFVCIGPSNMATCQRHGGGIWRQTHHSVTFHARHNGSPAEPQVAATAAAPFGMIRVACAVLCVVNSRRIQHVYRTPQPPTSWSRHSDVATWRLPNQLRSLVQSVLAY